MQVIQNVNFELNGCGYEVIDIEPYSCGYEINDVQANSCGFDLLKSNSRGSEAVEQNTCGYEVITIEPHGQYGVETDLFSMVHSKNGIKIVDVMGSISNFFKVSIVDSIYKVSS
jgi:hypothetical protein